MLKNGILTKALLVVVILILAIQLAPYGRNHSNPPVRSEPAWDRPETRELARRACFDCHSNETVWPRYAQIAPMSWLIQHDVVEGRRALNFSEWQRPQEEAGEAAKSVREREMPPWMYTLLHPEARLSPEERSTLIHGLEATIGTQVLGSLHAANVRSTIAIELTCRMLQTNANPLPSTSTDPATEPFRQESLYF